MSPHLTWLKTARVQYPAVIQSHHKLLYPVVMPIKRALRKLLKFLIVPVIDEINTYHGRVVLEMEALRGQVEDRSELEALHSEISALRTQLSETNGKLSEANEKLNASTARIGELETWVGLNARILEPMILDRYKHTYGVITDATPLQQPLASSLACRKEMVAYADWARRMAIDPTVMHRKHWEWIYIAQVLFERDKLKPGKKGLGFAVGSEPLPALFASYGAQVTATDLGEDNPEAENWRAGNQHADNIAILERPDVCDKDTFYKHVQFMPMDMNDIPDTVSGYDFCWSSCAFEHLGSVERGREFILNTLKLLNPGGVSVHTTEFNLSVEESVDTIYGAVYGKHFFESLRDEITEMGHYFAPLDYRIGNHPDDDYIYRFDGTAHHLKLLLGHCISTSIGIIIVKAEQA